MAYNVEQMKTRILHFIADSIVLIALLFTFGTGSLSLSASAMPNMGKEMARNQCESSCTSQSNIAVPGQKIEFEDKEVEPQPAVLRHLDFTGVGWTMVITIAAVYLLSYLRWRPPDLYKLNVNYRF